MRTGWGMIPDGDAQVMIDNHDNQRGHGKSPFIGRSDLNTRR